ncbi:transporter, major facilitator family domain protein [Burkholderia pseudomallei MSHR4503]|nr:transporter, major facilitator family domain protein [Burkholderia pseudomallei MSHR4503]
MQADAGGRFSSADHGLGRARRRSSLVGRGCVRLDLARLVGGVHRRARGSGIRRRNALKEPLGGMAGPVLSCCRAVVLSCCRAVVLSCCRAVVLSCCRAIARLLDCSIARLRDCAIARLRDCVVGCARGRAVACSCVRVFVRRHGRVCAERSFDRAPSDHGARRAKSACARPCGAGSHGFTAHARGATACRFRRYRPSPTMPTSDTNASSEKNSASGSHSPR